MGLEFHANMDLALHYAIHRNKLAIECAQRAYTAAVVIGNPEWAWRANDLLCALWR